MTPEPAPSFGERVPCPACAEPVLPAARKCRWCGEWFAELWTQRGETGPRPIEAIADPWAAPSSDVFDDIRRDAEIAGSDDGGSDEISQAMLRVDAIALEVGSQLAQLADPEVGGGELLERLSNVRRRIAMEFGLIAPGVRVRPHPGLAPGQYQIRVKGDLVADGEVNVGQVLCVGPDLDIPGIEVENIADPIYGTPAVWIAEEHEQRAHDHGAISYDAQDVMCTHLSEIVKQHLAEFLTREETAELLNMARQDSPMVVQELVPNMLALGQVRQVLQHLVSEQVSIKDLSTILNTLADKAIYTKDPHALTEQVRVALGRRICARYQSQDGLLRAFMLSPDAERAIQNAIQLNETGQVLMLDPATSNAIQSNLGEALDRHRGQIVDPVVVTPPKIRRHVKALLERNFSKIVVLSYAEVVAGVSIEPLESIEAHLPGELPRFQRNVLKREPEGHRGAWLVSEDEGDAVDPDNDAMDWNW